MEGRPGGAWQWLAARVDGGPVGMRGAGWPAGAGAASRAGVGGAKGIGRGRSPLLDPLLGPPLPSRRRPPLTSMPRTGTPVLHPSSVSTTYSQPVQDIIRPPVHLMQCNEEIARKGIPLSVCYFFREIQISSSVEGFCSGCITLGGIIRHTTSERW